MVWLLGILLLKYSRLFFSGQGQTFEARIEVPKAREGCDKRLCNVFLLPMPPGITEFAAGISGSLYFRFPIWTCIIKFSQNSCGARHRQGKLSVFLTILMLFAIYFSVSDTAAPLISLLISQYVVHRVVCWGHLKVNDERLLGKNHIAASMIIIAASCQQYVDIVLLRFVQLNAYFTHVVIIRGLLCKAAHFITAARSGVCRYGRLFCLCRR